MHDDTSGWPVKIVPHFAFLTCDVISTRELVGWINKHMPFRR